MIRLKVGDLLAAKGWTAYRLAQETGITVPVAYRLAKPDGAIKRLDFETLNRLCTALNMQPADLLDFVADTKPRAGKHTVATGRAPRPRPVSARRR